MVSTTCAEACQETQVKPTTESTTENVNEDEVVKAQKLFQQGKKNLILNKYDEATNNIADACKIYSTKYGELNYNCAELYFYYGKALLELSRVENTVLGNALTGVPEDSEPINDSRYGNPDQVPEEEREEIFDKVIDAMCPEETANKEQQQQPASTEPTTETATTTTTTEGGETEKKTEEKVDNESVVTPKEDAAVEESKKEEVVVNGDEKKEEMEEGDEEEGEEEDEEGEDVDVDEKGDKKAEDGTGAGGEEDDDDVTNLQQSWEMFELAKVIYNKQIDSIQDNDEKIKIKIRISECLLKLGEIGIEQELFEQAINDLKESIKIQEELNVNDRDERLLAETYYQLTLAYQFNNDFDLAKESHKKSTNILDIRIEKLRAKLSDAAANLSESEKTEINDEILELEKLLPEMILKLEEINDQNEKQLNLIKEAAKECFLSEKPSSNHPSTTTTTTTTQNDTNGGGGEVKDITELIKSKRKLSTDKLDTNCKKTKVDDETTTTSENGEQQQQAQNGTHESEKPMETTTVEPTTTTTTPVETQ